MSVFKAVLTQNFSSVSRAWQIFLCCMILKEQEFKLVFNGEFDSQETDELEDEIEEITEDLDEVIDINNEIMEEQLEIV